MALAKTLMGAGFSAGQASAIGGNYTAYAAAGSTNADATAIGAGASVVTGADGTKGVILTGQAGDSITIVNNSGSTLKVYPTSGAAIVVPGSGMGTTDAAYSHTTYAVVTYRCLTSTLWCPSKSA